jgi:hypothetical protein
MTIRELEESQIEKIMRSLALEASTEVDAEEKKRTRRTAYDFAYLVASGNTKMKFRYVAMYETALQQLEIKR